MKFLLVFLWLVAAAVLVVPDWPWYVPLLGGLGLGWAVWGEVRG